MGNDNKRKKKQQSEKKKRTLANLIGESLLRLDLLLERSLELDAALLGGLHLLVQLSLVLLVSNTFF